jgi:hypothetical protein
MLNAPGLAHAREFIPRNDLVTGKAFLSKKLVVVTFTISQATLLEMTRAVK